MPQSRQFSTDPEKYGLPKWMNARWRPAMAWLYILVVFCDFIAFPIGHAALAAAGYIPYSDWKPLTIQGGGIFHLAMGAILGVTAWGQTQERVYWGAGNMPAPPMPYPPAPPPAPPGPVAPPQPGPPPAPSGRAD